MNNLTSNLTVSVKPAKPQLKQIIIRSLQGIGERTDQSSSNDVHKQKAFC